MESTVAVSALVTGRPADEVFARLADFTGYPGYAPSVRRVTREGAESTWRVEFRRGILEWTERDDVDPVRRRIGFALVRGDFASFGGSWCVAEAAGGVRVEFTATFDLGLGSMAPLVDPVAAQALRDGVRQILRGVFAGDVEIRGPTAGRP